MKKNTASKDKISQSAFILFQKYGYTKTTTKMIAKAADVNETTIFNIYGSKAKLFHEIYYTLPPAASHMPLERLTSGRDLRSDLYLLIYEYMKLTIQNFPMYRFSMPLIDVIEEDLHARSSSIVAKNMEMFIIYFQYLETIDAIRSCDYQTMVQILFSSVLIKSFDLVTRVPDEEHPEVAYDEEELRLFADQYTDWFYHLLALPQEEDAT